MNQYIHHCTQVDAPEAILSAFKELCKLWNFSREILLNKLIHIKLTNGSSNFDIVLDHQPLKYVSIEPKITLKKHA